MKVFVAIFCLSLASTSYAKSCLTKGDCGHDECCFNHHGPMIVSRQLQEAGLQLQKGVCEKYKNLGDDCSPFDTLNGHCGCKSGMTCGFVPASTTTTMKRKLYFPGPGAYLCKIADNADN